MKPYFDDMPIAFSVVELILGENGEPVDFVWPTEKMATYLTTLPAGRAFLPSDPLFSKITPERLEELKVKYKETES